MRNNEYLIGELLHIDNKEGNVVPFKFNRVQSHFHRNKSFRNIILKARQMGVTSSILADMFIDDVTQKHLNCVVVSHETRATQRLLDKVHFYYDTMEEPKPRLGADCRTELSFPDMHSSIFIGSAGSRAFGRGDMIRKAHLSELAFYDDARKVLSGIEDAVPMKGELTIESTANGEDNVFYEKWVEARNGQSPYKPFFYPWWWDIGYYIERGSDLALPDDRGELIYTEEEQELVTLHGLCEGQIRWRRWKMAEKHGLFFIEYPENEIDCFLANGNPVYDLNILSNLANNCYEGNKHEDGWTFWIPPIKGHRYIIAADTSAGTATGSLSGAVVLSRELEVVATFNDRIEPVAFAALLKKLGAWYNQAEIAVERNFTGYTVLSHMQDYSNLYYQRNLITNKVSSQVGWWTADNTKRYMLTTLKDKLPNLRVWDANLIRQIKSYKYIRMQPTATIHDDLAIALMIALSVNNTAAVSCGYMGTTNNWGW
jgi:hypothetical protein